jgi:hypothetical protein
LVFFVLFVAILNLALGYGLALYLHRGQFLPDSWSFPLRLQFFSAGKEPDEENEQPHSGSYAASRNADSQAASSAAGSTLSSAAPANSMSGAKSNAVLAKAGEFDDDEPIDPRLIIDEPATTAVSDSGR